MSNDPKQENFWEQFHDVKEQSEARLMQSIHTAMSDSPKATANVLRGWMKSDKPNPERPKT